MEITLQQKNEIEKIMQEMNCKKDFECYKSGFTKLPKVRRIGKLIECPKENPDCDFAMPFGYGYFCRCPLMNHVQKNLIP